MYGFAVPTEPGPGGCARHGRGGHGHCLKLVQDRRRCILFTGFYSMVTSLVCLMFLLYRFNSRIDIYQYQETYGISQLAMSLVWMSSHGVMSVCALVLIFGAIKDNRHFLLPWLLFSVLSVVIEFWALIRLFHIFAALTVVLSCWELVYTVLFATRLLIHIVCFGLVVVHGRRMFSLDKKRAHLSGCMNHNIPEVVRGNPPPDGQAVLPVTVASPSYFTVSSSFEAACSVTPPPYTEGPPAYKDVISMTADQPSVA